LLDEYKAHPRRYDRAASRDLLLIFNSKRKTIYKALAALKRGQSFKRVAARFSSDSGSGKNGGRFPGVEKGQFPRKLDRAVFKAKRGKLIGPIKTQYGYYLVRVTRINKRRARTFEEAREDIHEYLLDQKQTAIAETAQKSFESRWKPATLCRTGYVAKVCGAYSN
jgi:foldase protein PrsA